MSELQLLWAWMTAHLDSIRVRQHERHDGQDPEAGFTTLEWVAIAAVVIVAAIVVATLLMNKAKTAAGNVNVQ